MKRILALILLLTAFVRPCLAEQWTFAVFSDNTSEFSSYRNVLDEIRSRSVKKVDSLSPLDLVVAVGDISPVPKNYSIFKEVFPKSPPLFLPVRGNHERADDLQFILGKILPSQGDRINRQNATDVSYFVDWKNARIIILDQYSVFGKPFDNPGALSWLRKAIESGTSAEHIFIAFHEPYFPENPSDDPFWSLLLKHRDKVRAVLCGHYHIYFRKYFPENGADIVYINAGNAGQTSHSDRHQTFVAITVDGKDVEFRAIQAPDQTKDFKVTDEWKHKGKD